MQLVKSHFMIIQQDVSQSKLMFIFTFLALTTTVDDLLTEIYLEMPVDEWLKGDLRVRADYLIRR